MPSVAVIMSIYKNDNLEHLKLAIKSIINQTYPCDLFMIGDGNLPPPINTYLDEIASDKTIKTRLSIKKRSKNIGLAGSLNELIDAVLSSKNNYQYIARMDADDISEENRIFLQVNFMQANPEVDVLGTGCAEFSDNSQEGFVKLLPIHDTALKKNIIKRSPFIHPSVIFRRRVFEEGQRYPINTYLAEDYAFWVDLASKNYTFANIDKALLQFRFDHKTINRRQGLKKAKTDFIIRLAAMKKLKIISLANIAYTFAFFLLRIMPSYFAKIAYRHFR